MRLIERHIQEIRDLCLRHKVLNLSVFGSILTTSSTKRATWTCL